MSKKVLRSIALITMIVLAFSVSAAAIGFKPSVDIKKGPDYVTPDGFQYEVIITPIGEADNQTDERVQEGLKHLKNVYEDLKDKNITDIVDKAAPYIPIEGTSTIFKKKFRIVIPTMI